ncbi:MAG TPA: hypothetical protein VMO26_08995 [Vicinamibacterales bacterium]|nr:hypothetical protein [Vicinamibacterales bacterium]
MSARPRAKTARTPPVPLGLTVLAGYSMPEGFNREMVLGELRRIDALAAADLLATQREAPAWSNIGDLVNVEDTEAEALKAIASCFAETKTPCASPVDAASEIISELTHRHGEAGFWLGFCTAYRLYAALVAGGQR